MLDTFRVVSRSFAFRLFLFVVGVLLLMAGGLAAFVFLMAGILV